MKAGNIPSEHLRDLKEAFIVSMENPTTPEARDYKGHAVIDEHGMKVGKITDVLYDDKTLPPRWIIVNLGVFAAQHYVPLNDAYQSEDGRLVIPFDKKTVKSAPRAGKDHILTRAVEEQLLQHYQLAA
jgi:sporulation protein YlmC with PRC-barrel domain